MKRQLITVGLAASAILAFASISATLAAPGSAPLAQAAESEPNDTFDDADTVPVPGYVTGVITRSVSAADTDLFVINTQIGREYRARLSIWTAGPLKLQMNLYNGDREYLETSPSSSSYASITWTAYQDTHYIQIEALDPNTTTLQTAHYQLNIDGFTAVPTPSAVPPPGKDDYEPNDSISEAYVLPVSASVSATYANFYPPPDEDWYAFYVKGGRTYRATTSNLAPTGDPDDTYDLIVYEVSPGTVRVWLPLCFRCSGDTI